MAVAFAPPADAAYYPQPRQESWHECPAYESGYGGAKGGGKTLALLAELYRGTVNPRYRGVIFRRTYPRLQEVMDRAWQWFPRLGGHWLGSEHRWLFPNGSWIAMRHCQYEDDKFQYNGHEYHRMGFDQLEEFSDTQYLYLLAQNRSGVQGIAPDVRVTFNPGGVGHAWVKDRFVDHGSRDCAPWMPTNEEGDALPSRCFHFSTIEDNPALGISDPGYRQRLDMLPEEERRALKLGDWDVFAGQMFTEWRRSKHVMEPAEIPDTFVRWRCIDDGVSRPFVCHWLAQDPSTLRVYVYRSLSKRNVFPATKRAQMILAESPKGEKIRFTVGDPSMWNRSLDTGLSVEDSYRAAGLSMVKGSNERIDGLNRVREFLADAPDGLPYLRVFSTATELIKNMPSLIRDPHRVEDVDTDGPDDEYDALRYGLMRAHWVQAMGRPKPRALVARG